MLELSRNREVSRNIQKGTNEPSYPNSANTFSKCICFEALDFTMSHIQSGFHRECYKVVQGFETHAAPPSKTEKQVQDLLQVYGSNFSHSLLITWLHLLQVKCQFTERSLKTVKKYLCFPS